MAKSKVTLRMSAAAAAYVMGDAPKEGKMQAARGEAPVNAAERGALLFYLASDPDGEVKAAAIKCLKEMPEDEVLDIVDAGGVHPIVLDVLARLHYKKTAVAERLSEHPAIDTGTLAFLAEMNMQVFPFSPEGSEEVPVAEALEDDEDSSPVEEAIGEEGEEYQTKYQMAQTMVIADKIKIALTGDKEWRSIFIKDANKLVSGSVIKNPRITEPEILAITKTSVQNDEIIRLICANKEWVKNYQIRKALIENHKTPLASALRYMSSLTEKDLAALAKSKNVSSVIATQARRVLLNKQKH